LQKILSRKFIKLDFFSIEGWCISIESVCHYMTHVKLSALRYNLLLCL